MIKRAGHVCLSHSGQVVLLCCLASSTLAFGGAKQYPLEGRVVALGTTNEVMNGSTSRGLNGTGGTTITSVHRTYTIKSPTRVYVLECPYWMSGFHISSPSECGGGRNIQVGDVLRFRMVKNYAYIPTDKGKEQRLNTLSEAESDPLLDQANP